MQFQLTLFEPLWPTEATMQTQLTAPIRVQIPDGLADEAERNGNHWFAPGLSYMLRRYMENPQMIGHTLWIETDDGLLAQFSTRRVEGGKFTILLDFEANLILYATQDDCVVDRPDMRGTPEIILRSLRKRFKREGDERMLAIMEGLLANPSINYRVSDTFDFNDDS